MVPALRLAGQNRSAREIERRLNLLGLCAEDISAAMEEIAPQSEAACRAVVEKHYRAKLAAGQREKVLAALESKADLARTLVDDYRSGRNPFAA